MIHKSQFIPAKRSSMKDLKKLSHPNRPETQHERVFFPSRVSRPLFQRAGNNTIRHMRSDCSARRRRSPTQTTPLLPPPPSPSPPAPPPLPLPSPQSVGRSVSVESWGLLLQSRSASTRPPARPSFQVVEVELVAHLPTEWKKKKEKKRERGGGATGFEGPLSLLSFSGQEVK